MISPGRPPSYVSVVIQSEGKPFIALSRWEVRPARKGSRLCVGFSQQGVGHAFWGENYDVYLRCTDL